MNILSIIGLYFIAGIIMLVLLDIMTGSVRRWFKSAPYDTQQALVNSSYARSFVGVKTAAVLAVGTLLIFWPLAVVMAVINKARSR